MTNKIYKSAQGKSVDLGTIVLQNEHVRAVGNMKVNARGDKLDSNNRVVETKARQIQKQNDRTTTNVSTAPVHSSSSKARSAQSETVPDPIVSVPTTPPPAPEPEAPTPVVLTPVAEPVVATPEPSMEPVTGGLAEAIAKSREVKQNLDKTRRQSAQAQGVRKI